MDDVDDMEELLPAVRVGNDVEVDVEAERVETGYDEAHPPPQLSNGLMKITCDNMNKLKLNDQPSMPLGGRPSSDGNMIRPMEHTKRHIRIAEWRTLFITAMSEGQPLSCAKDFEFGKSESVDSAALRDNIWNALHIMDDHARGPGSYRKTVPVINGHQEAEEYLGRVGISLSEPSTVEAVLNMQNVEATGPSNISSDFLFREEKDSSKGDGSGGRHGVRGLFAIEDTEDRDADGISLAKGSSLTQETCPCPKFHPSRASSSSPT
ncbi:hypothetical protein BU16DRAFT_564304 [Lophium mytilinum]|uniref:Uncharacterized protein n=1 Tax=Lophium mytilinum TaxID=390894 RepID=A0A6A6QL26_9PEZI|nr:hypothetical protein BU16DRAFT_564304 [Lophium mytilinum]